MLGVGRVAVGSSGAPAVLGRYLCERHGPRWTAGGVVSETTKGSEATSTVTVDSTTQSHGVPPVSGSCLLIKGLLPPFGVCPVTGRGYTVGRGPTRVPRVHTQTPEQT